MGGEPAGELPAARSAAVGGFGDGLLGGRLGGLFHLGEAVGDLLAERAGLVGERLRQFDERAESVAVCLEAVQPVAGAVELDLVVSDPPSMVGEPLVVFVEFGAEAVDHAAQVPAYFVVSGRAAIPGVYRR